MRKICVVGGSPLANDEAEVVCHSEWSPNRDSDTDEVKNPVIGGRLLRSTNYYGILRFASLHSE